MRGVSTVAIPETNVATHAEMYRWAGALFPICRSLTGDGVRETLRYLKDKAPQITLHEVATGTRCFDWIVPDEWNIEEAYIIGPTGEKIIDFRNSNLHVLGYSTPIDVELDLDELQQNLHSIEDNPDAIPYVTSYYVRRWGFCLSHNQRKNLQPGKYRAVIKSKLAPGSLTYGEAILPGSSSSEVLISTYVCHPSMANNEISGPVVATALIKWLAEQSNRRLTYRFVFVPETLGSIVYLSKNYEHMLRHTEAGFVVTCVGDDRAYSFLPSKEGGTISDRAAKHVLKYFTSGYDEYSFLTRGSDERQYCHPRIGLPVASVMRSKYDTYPEYHTSFDNLDVISPQGLGGSFEIYRLIIALIERNHIYRCTTLCEPNLGRRNLYPSLSRKETYAEIADLINVLAHADGELDLIGISDRIDRPFTTVSRIVDALLANDLVEPVDRKSESRSLI